MKKLGLSKMQYSKPNYKKEACPPKLVERSRELDVIEGNI